MTSFFRSSSSAVATYDIYELYGSDDVLLYVGITRQAPGERLDEHRYNQPWAPEIRSQRIVYKDLSKRDALQIEKELIRSKRPIYNLQHSRNRRAARMAIDNAEATYGPARADLLNPRQRRTRPFLPSRRGRKSDAAAFASIAIILFQVWQKLSPDQRKWVIGLSLVGLCIYFVSTELQ